MPYTRGTTFKVDLSFINRFSKRVNFAVEFYGDTMKQRVTLATDMVWRVAHQKRPLISKSTQRFLGRSSKSRRVSDPYAQLGVPVNTGRLQASIQQRVYSVGVGKYEGEISTKGVEYAGAMEFGTSRVAARPFMRPAIAKTTDAIKRLFNLKVNAKF